MRHVAFWSAEVRRPAEREGYWGYWWGEGGGGTERVRVVMQIEGRGRSTRSNEEKEEGGVRNKKRERSVPFHSWSALDYSTWAPRLLYPHRHTRAAPIYPSSVPFAAQLFKRTLPRGREGRADDVRFDVAHYDAHRIGIVLVPHFNEFGEFVGWIRDV